MRVGDRVTKTTEMTTVDENAALEVYLNVPVQQATELRVGLPVRLLDEQGKPIVTEKINFISPSVDDRTQTVLAKLPLSAPAGFRTSQFVRAAVVWSTDPGLTIPLTSASRINGGYFVFVADPGEGEPVAKQRGDPGPM